MKSKKKLPLLFGTLAAGVVCLTMGIGTVFGGDNDNPTTTPDHLFIDEVKTDTDGTEYSSAELTYGQWGELAGQLQFVDGYDTTIPSPADAGAYAIYSEIQNDLLNRGFEVCTVTVYGLGENGDVATSFYVAKGATVKISTTTATNDTIQAGTSKIIATAKTGFELEGWYPDFTLTTAWTTNTTINTNVNIYPKWKKAINYWDGTVATSFASGAGTNTDPCIIETPQQLAYLAQAINTNNLDSSKYRFELANDIYLNDETFTYDSNSGLVTITDGTNTIYVGTGQKSTTSGAYYRDTSKNSATNNQSTGHYYISNNVLYYRNGTSGDFSTCNMWTPIGTSSNYSTYDHFYGNNHTIYGMYINSTSNDQGLFGKFYHSFLISNVIVANGAVISTGSNIGGIVGQLSVDDGASGGDKEIENCTTYCIVCGGTNVGGVVGLITALGTSASFNDCNNEGYVNGEKCTGTTKIYGKADTNCFVAGTKVLTSKDKNNKTYTNIENLQVDDYVASYNHDNNQIEMKKVTKVLVHNDGGYNVLKLKVKNKAINEITTVEVTKEHRFYSLTKQDYVALEYINVGETLQLSNGNCEVISIENSRIVDVVYNIEVEDNHNYFVTDADILVHNAKYPGSVIVDGVTVEGGW